MNVFFIFWNVFSHVETNKSSVRRLLHVKGNKNVIARKVFISL